MATIADIYEFIDTAQRNHKYPPATAQGLRVATKIFEAELNEDELKSLEKVKSNLNQISQSVYAKNKSNFTAGTLNTYRTRLVKVIADFEKYGSDPSKLANWSPKTVTRSPRRAPDKTDNSTPAPPSPAPDPAGSAVPVNMHSIELALRPDVKFKLIIPWDLRKTEVDTLKSILDSLAVNGGGHDADRVQEAPSE